MTGDHQTPTETDVTESRTTVGNPPPQADAFAELPPSAKLVHYALDRDDDRTQTELVEETALSPRTVRTALSRLEDAGLVTESICLRDARKRMYELTAAGDAIAAIEMET